MENIAIYKNVNIIIVFVLIILKGLLLKIILNTFNSTCMVKNMSEVLYCLIFVKKKCNVL